jgi:hypothetical protein
VRLIPRIVPKLALTLVAFGLCVIGWITRTSFAQNPPQDPPPLPMAEASPVSPPQDLAVPKVELPRAGAAVDASPAAQLLDFPDRANGPATHPAPAPSLTAPAALSSVAATVKEDPEKAALAFAEENQKQAEAQLRALKDEEAKLRARLRKVEAGIKRWQTLLLGLKQSQGDTGGTLAPRAVQVRRGPEPERIDLDTLVKRAEDLKSPRANQETRDLLPAEPSNDPFRPRVLPKQ